MHFGQVTGPIGSKGKRAAGMKDSRRWSIFTSKAAHYCLLQLPFNLAQHGAQPAAIESNSARILAVVH